MLVLSSLLAACLAQEPSEDLPTELPPISYESRESDAALGRKLQQARDLRLAGTILPIAGPVAGIAGLGLFVTGNNRGDGLLQGVGVLLGATGVMATLAGPWLSIGGGALASGVAWRAHRTTVRPTAGIVAGGLFVVSAGGLIAAVAVVDRAPAASTGLFVSSVVLYAASAITAGAWAGRAIRSGEGRSLTLAPMRSHDGAWGVVISGRF